MMNKQRLLSLDALRGFTVAAMLLVNDPGDWGHIYGPLEHAEWNGWTFTDAVFPFFLFMSGMAMTMSLARRAQLGADKTRLLLTTWRRGLTIIAIGLALNAIGHSSIATVRFPGVLQRIGLCTLLAAPAVIWLGWRAQLAAFVALLAGYSAIQLGLPVPDAQGIVHQGSLVAGQDVGAWLDRLVLDGHMWVQSKTWDPEGLLSTLPAVATLLAGVLAGHWLAVRRDPGEKAMWFMVASLPLLWLAQIGNAWLMPINKSLWTPSYVLLMAGWASFMFGIFYWLLDAMPLPLWRARWARLAHPFVVFGMNALFMFALSGLVGRLLVLIKNGAGLTLKGMIYAPIQALPLAPVDASLVYAIGFVAVMYAAAWFMFKRRWFFKV
jgi:predicted acyltransferase